MNTKFYEKFVSETDGKYPELKLNGATYDRTLRELEVRFIINVFDKKNFTEDKEREVREVVERMFNGVKVKVTYIKTYADSAVVKNKILEFLNSENQLVFRQMTDDALKVSVSDGCIRVTLVLEEAVCSIIRASDTLEKLKNYLDSHFNETVILNVEEVPDRDAGVIYVENTVIKNDSLRLVDVKTGNKIYARGKIETINKLPSYIVDVRAEGDGVVLCGKVYNLSSSTYRNKKYDPKDKKSGAEFRPIVRFSINDTTGTMECVCFPNEEEAREIEKIRDGSEVVCAGRVSTSQHTGGLSFMLNAIFECEINFDSIHPVRRKPAPEHYLTVFPQNYSGVGEQESLIDETKSKIDKFFAGKTIVVFDLETTSTSVATTEIVEIGAIKIENGVETKTFSTLVKPKSPIPPETTAINHITNEMVAYAPSIDRVLPDFFKFAEGATLAGHNAESFDFPIIKRFGNEAGYYFDNPVVDTLLLSRRYIPGRSNYRLENIARDMGFVHTDAHRALSDVEATVALLREIAKRM